MATSPSVFREYSTFNPVVLEKRGRLKIAKQIFNVLESRLKNKKLKSLNVLDIGCSSGIISDYLSHYFGHVEAIDNDSESIAIAKKNYRGKNVHFRAGDAGRTGYSNESFDIIIANQIYYCFEEPRKFMTEVVRILRRGGIVFFGARNKYTLWDAQYHLPLLAFLPKFLADFMVRFFGRSDKFNAKYMNYWELGKLVDDFEVERLTPKILKNPNYYGFKDIAKISWLTRLFPISFWSFAEPILPNFIWILRKK